MLERADGAVSVARGSEVVEARQGDAIQQGSRVETWERSTAVLRLGDHVRAALGPGSSLEIRSVSPEGADVVLGRGWLVCDVDPGRLAAGLTVRAPGGRVEVLGTRFAVEIGQGGELEVRVLRGRVAWVSDRGGASVELEAGESAVLPGSAAHRLADDLARRDAALLGGELVAAGGERVEPDLGQLFAEAEQARREGEHERAAARYRRIAARDPGGAAGGTALVSLGQLSLGPLGRPADARRAFSDYLASHPSGPLREEAWVGLIRAELALGHTDAARVAAARYLRDHPSGRYARIAEELVRDEP
jgi:hypothetical protein